MAWMSFFISSSLVNREIEPEKECLRGAGVPLSFAKNIIRERNKRVRGLISANKAGSVRVCMEGLATEAAA